MPTRPGRNFRVATSLYTLDHNQQQRTNFNDARTRQVEDGQFSWQSRQVFEGAAAMKLGEHVDSSGSYFVSRLEIYCVSKRYHKVRLSHQLGNAALPALQL